jgi:hypothetical protein
MRAIRPVLLAALLVLAVAAPTLAARPDRVYQPLAITLADGNLHLVIFINTTRAAYCTPERVQWEEDVIAGDAGDPPAPPDGFAPILTQTTQTRHGTDYSERGTGLIGEVWRMVSDPPSVGPCTDSDPSGRVLVGTAGYSLDLKNIDGDRPFEYDEQALVIGGGAKHGPHLYYGHLHGVDGESTFRSWLR